jgi:hypothetical protein
VNPAETATDDPHSVAVGLASAVHDSRVVQHQQVMFYPPVIDGDIVLDVYQLMDDFFRDFFTVSELNPVGGPAVGIQTKPSRMRDLWQVRQQTVCKRGLATKGNLHGRDMTANLD